jgi:sarcosine oxidase, subunit gamma
MVDIWDRSSALPSRHHYEIDAQQEAGVSLSEIRGTLIYRLFGPIDDPGFMGRVTEILEMELPMEAGRANGEGNVVVPFAPGEWLVCLGNKNGPEVGRELERFLESGPGSLTNLSHGRTVITVSGDCARDVLAKGCALDLHPQAFAPGQCAQTQIAGIATTLRHMAAPATYELIVPRSFAHWFWHWLISASDEYGYQVAEPRQRSQTGS